MDNIQCNEVTSSDDEGESASSSKYASRVPSGSAPRDASASRKSLSRELASLQLDSPLFGSTSSHTAKSRRSAVTRRVSAGVAVVRRRGRSILPAAINRETGSDTENQREEMVPASKLVEINIFCRIPSYSLDIEIL